MGDPAPVTSPTSAVRPLRSGRIISSTDVGTVNRAQLLRALLASGPMSRADLARLLDVPRATITAIVTPLVREGTVIEGEARPASGLGKPSRPLWFSPGASSCAAISFTTTELLLARVDASGDVAQRQVHPLPARRRGASLQKWLTARIAATFGPVHGLSCAGVTLAARCDPETGLVLRCTPQPAFEGVNLMAMVDDALGVPCVVERDVQALAAAERWYGARHDDDDFAIVETGTGIGVGIILKGALYRATSGLTTQPGHICVDPQGERCSCGLHGCWEMIASTLWLEREARRHRVPGPRTIADLTVRAATDGRAAAVLDRYADNVAVGLATLHHVLGLPLFVMSGSVAAGGAALRELIEQRLHARTTDQGERPRVEFSLLGEDASLYGSAAVALNHNLRLAL